MDSFDMLFFIRKLFDNKNLTYLFIHSCMFFSSFNNNYYMILYLFRFKILTILIGTYYILYMNK